MALSDIFAGVKAEFDLIRPGVEWFDGGEHLGANAAPPRVVWMPTDDAFKAPEVHETDGYKLAEGARPLLQCDATVAVHLWGATRDDAEELRNAFIVALRRSTAASFSVSRGQWLRPEQGVVVAGRVYVLFVSFPTLILDAAPSLGTITTVQSTDVSIDPPPGP